jgi:hypothetical protein
MMGKRLVRRKLESLVVREERMVISKLHQKPSTKMLMLLNPTLLRNKLDTTPDPPIFPHSTNDFQKPIKFKSNLRNEFHGKESVKASEEKLVEKPSGEKPNEHPHPKPKPKPIKFHCVYCLRDGHRVSFASRGSLRR